MYSSVRLGLLALPAAFPLTNSGQDLAPPKRLRAGAWPLRLREGMVFEHSLCSSILSDVIGVMKIFNFSVSLLKIHPSHSKWPSSTHAARRVYR